MLPAETVETMREMGVAPSLVPVGTEQTFQAPPLQGEELFLCPMLSETGCTMGDRKPFDCRIWPFRMMRDAGGTLRIAVAGYCPGMQGYTDAQLRAFLEEGLGEVIFSYASKHPAHVKAYSPDYRMIL